MIVMRTCSLIENGPGLSDTPKILTLGTTRAHTRMMGNDTNCATIYSSGTKLRTAFPKINDGTTYTGDGHGREPEKEELVKTRDKNSPADTNEPCAECSAWHVRVVGVGDG